MNNEAFFEKVITASTARHQPRTVHTYMSRLKALSKHYPDKNLSALNVDEINEFLLYLKKTRKYKPASLRTTRDAFHFAYNILLKSELKIDKYSMKWSDREEVNIPSQGELFAIFEAIQNPVFKTIVEFMYGTGIELSEVLRIKVKDVDFTKNIVKVKLNRNKGHRDVLLPQKVKKSIEAQCLDKKKNCLVFSESCLKAVHPTSIIQKAFRKAVKRNLNQSGYDLRSLRYAYVKHLESMNVPLMSITDHLKLSKQASLEFFTRIGVVETNINFSPLDRKVNEEFKHSNELEQYISDSRINDIESLKSIDFDFSKLCQFLRELNNAFEQKQLLTIPMLVRSIINHIPPIFKCKNFSEVANNYSGSGNSFKQSMKNLDQQLKHIADLHLHQQIRKKESLPEPQQIDFRPALDLLLQEIFVQYK